ncbi:hypothetical protein Tco_1006046 [Tanacetum coccineum]|uniref:Uncharacterized protein n=1 Tax=Tanacetum coccineum TaxID=301880 RepID=A0ABQ5FHJ3_9ASTR
MAAWIIEKALEVALAGLKALAPGLLAKAAELLAKAAPKVVREAVAQALTKLADTAMKGKEVAKSAQTQEMGRSYMKWQAIQVERRHRCRGMKSGDGVGSGKHSVDRIVALLST